MTKELRKTADDNQAEFSVEVIQSVKQNFYVDDCLKSSATESESHLMYFQDCSVTMRDGLM